MTQGWYQEHGWGPSWSIQWVNEYSVECRVASPYPDPQLSTLRLIRLT